ncbi:MAG: aminomethyl-transferring glycine dehydrogenase [Planctomycetota bacterium]
MLQPLDTFAPRHLGPSDADLEAMLHTLGFESLEALTDAVVPAAIRLETPLTLDGLAGAPEVAGEQQVLADLRKLAEQNQMFRSFIGAGYYGTVTPTVILRNIMENPGWYTQYTPYQAEISQGRLEALLNYQTMVADLTGLPLANASLLDEATAAAEAMAMCFQVGRGKKKAFYAADHCHPQTLAVVRTRAESMGVELRVGPADAIDFAAGDLCGVLVQYPDTLGGIHDFESLAEQTHGAGALFVVAADILALTLLTPPGEFGADIAVGSTQRFGVPMGFGGPHAAYLSTHEKHARKIPGRLIGVSRDARGNRALRLAIQTREQHIKRDRATSNICTAQVLLAIMAAMYAVYHGPTGLKRIAQKVRAGTRALAKGLIDAGYDVAPGELFDTIAIGVDTAEKADTLIASLADRRINIRRVDATTLAISLDETVTADDLTDVLEALGSAVLAGDLDALFTNASAAYPAPLKRTSEFLTHEVFHKYHAEHEMLRYLHRLQSRDLSLTQSMIPLGSCTMKLNATTQMIPVTWPEFGALHPFAPGDQTVGYRKMFEQLERWLAQVTGFAATSLQPNAGSQGEYAGLLVIAAYHASRGDTDRDVCLIPTSAHGTNPASAVIAGFKVVPLACDEQGNIDLDDLRDKAAQHADRLGALMITYPSTHGVFEEAIMEICQIVHDHGGQVYMDGANMNAQVGLTSPGRIGADVCHLNLHKTFCIPHGGGGPGMGPIACAEHLAPFLPTHPVVAPDSIGDRPIGALSAAPYGSPSILPISWVYIALMGAEGLTKASGVAIANANYMAKRLTDHYDIVYTGEGGLVAHEFILDARDFAKTANVSVEDIAKRLMDYGFHAPTMSWPVAGTLMVEPTESESKEELDRFCDAMIAIREEIRAIEQGHADHEDNPLHHAPHTAQVVTGDDWPHAYSREQAAYPLAYLREHKFWPAVSRIDNPYGDRHLVCSCEPVEAMQEA